LRWRKRPPEGEARIEEWDVPVAVVTGASAGVGRAIAREFARYGYDVGLIARGRDRLEAAAQEVRALSVRASVAPADVADAAAVEEAAASIERDLGPIDVWVNNAMATVFSPVAETTPEEVKRGTEVTYLGTVHGVMAALKRMRLRDRGTIVNVGSALVYRSIPLQAVYCGAKAAIRGFTDSLRTELLHEGSGIQLSMVHLPAMNTPQFDWALNKMGRKAQPVPPIYQPEVAARAVVFAARNHRREIWVGFSTVAVILLNRIAPGLADRYLARAAYSAQLSEEREPPDAPENLYRPVPGHFAAHGRFDAIARDSSWEMLTSRHRGALTVIGIAGLAAGLRLVARRKRR
jgi:short-subunit dehydrogenase